MYKKCLRIYRLPMKNTKYIYSLLTICLFAFYSCSTDSNNSVKLLKKTISTSTNGTSLTTVFKYVDDKIVSTDDANKHVDFTYSEGLIVKKASLDKATSLVETIDYTYNAGKLIRV